MDVVSHEGLGSQSATSTAVDMAAVRMEME